MTDHEVLVSIYRLLQWGVGIGVAVLVVCLFALFYKRRSWMGVSGDVETARTEAKAFYDEILALLGLVRDVARGIRDNRKEATIAREAIAEALGSAPTREELARKIDEVPSRTVEQLKQGDSGSFPRGS